MPKNKGPKLTLPAIGGEDAIPPEFRAAMNRVETQQAVPNDEGPDALSATLVESSITTNRTDERVKKNVTRKAGPITLKAIRSNQSGQPVQVTRTLDKVGTAAPSTTATRSIAVQELGNGDQITEVSLEGDFTGAGGAFVEGVFADNSFAKERPDAAPEKFRVLLPTETTETTVAGTAAAPTLGSGDLAKSEKQVTPYSKRTSVTHRDPAATGALSGKRLSSEYGGGMLDVVETYGNASGEYGLGVVSSEVTPLGDGRFLTVTAKIPSGTWSTLTEYEYIAQLDAIITINKTVVAKGSTAGSKIGNTITEVKALDFAHELKIVTTIPSVSSYSKEYTIIVNRSFPDELVSAIFIEAYANAGAKYAWDAGLQMDIIEGYSGPCKGRVVETIVTEPSVGTEEPTYYFPQAHMVSGSWSATITGAETAAEAKVVHFAIPPCLHSSISLSTANMVINQTIPATSPETLTHGVEIIHDISFSQLPFGFWLKRIVYVTVP